MKDRNGDMTSTIAAALLVLMTSLGVAGCGSGTEATGPTTIPAPSITTLSPAGTSAGAVAFILNVKGSNFVQGSTVKWNGVSRATTFVSGGRLQAQIPAADLTAPGQVAVMVANPAPGPGNSNAAPFAIAAPRIAFQSPRALDGTDSANTNANGFETSNIWVMNPDGSGQTPLTNLTALLATSTLPSWSPDGGKITYSSERALDGSNARDLQNNNIWLMNADGSGQTPLTRLTDGGAETFASAYSPDGTKIAFLSARALDGSDVFNQPNLTVNVWIMNADGSNPKPLTHQTAAQAGAAHPVRWSPDSSRLAFSYGGALNGSDAANVNSTRNIWVVNADGTGLAPVTRLTSFAVNQGGPAWSPDGTKITYASPRALDLSDNPNTVNHVANIWDTNPDGTGQTALTQLTASNAGSFSPAWSPDGTKIAFVSSRKLDGTNAANTNTAGNVWVMNADGASPAPLTSLTAASVVTDAPTWTPDGAKLLFVSSRALDGSDAANANSTQNIWTMNADGSSPTPLTSLTSAHTSCTSPQMP
jgi:Tol biopolymer transport system component